MTHKKQSDIFKPILTQWKIFGIWFGRNANKKHKYYTCVNIFVNLVIYIILLTVNLFFTPRKITYLIPEVTFLITEVAIASKAYMVINKRDKILEAFNIMDGKDLYGEDDISKKIIAKDNANYSTFCKCFNFIGQLAFISLVFVPVILFFAIDEELKLPISQYYFLSDGFREHNFIYLYIYQSCAAYMHMTYNISIDSFVAGLLHTGVTQLRVLNNKLINLKLSDEEKLLSLKEQDEIQITRLRNLLMRYSLVLRYCKIVQHIISLNMFVVFGLASVIICVTLCELLFLPTGLGFFGCMIIYLIAMTLQIFLPAYLGSLVNYENTELVFAAYCTEWIPRSESFKKNLRIFIERTKSPIQFTGLKIFVMSLSTFTSIVKTAYSFFTLIRNFQE